MAASNGSSSAAELKLAFRVVYATSEDPDYPAVELNHHSPHTKGWNSERFCSYPQELGVEFLDAQGGGGVAISQIQLLSHQSKIATRVELFVGNGATYATAQFARLGYFSLDSNERSKFTARELKSVYLKAQGTFLKMLLHKCYLNDSNIFSQVCVCCAGCAGSRLCYLAGGFASVTQSTPAPHQPLPRWA